jgi:hypothetical protein
MGMLFLGGSDYAGGNPGSVILACIAMVCFLVPRVVHVRDHPGQAAR